MELCAFVGDADNLTQVFNIGSLHAWTIIQFDLLLPLPENFPNRLKMNVAS
jgi:hypothetical protein